MEVDPEVVAFWRALVTTAPGWVTLLVVLLFLVFSGFKIFVGTKAERILADTLRREQEGVCQRLDRLLAAVDRLTGALLR